MKTTSPHHEETAALVARLLLQAGCVQFRRDEPFRLPSGWASPVYMDCRRLTSFPQIRTRLVELALQRLQESERLVRVDSVVGAESSGIALAAWISDGLALPMHYVRKKAIDLGGRSQIEGAFNAGERVLLVDDLMAAGYSKQKFIEALTSMGAEVEAVLVIFDYGTFGAKEALAHRDVTVHALADWQAVLRVARDLDSVDPTGLDELQAFLRDPAKWSGDHGGIKGQTPA